MSEYRPLAIITGASTGIGYELAKLCARERHDLIIAADEAKIESAAQDLRGMGVTVTAVEANLATTEGVDKLLAAANGRNLDYVLANAGVGLGGGFLEQDFDRVRHVIDTNITGTLYLLHHVARQMRERGTGRILITGSIAGCIPGTFHAVYNGTKAFIDSFSYALRHEIKYSGVTVTCLIPGATETEFFERAEMMDTSVGQAEKDDAADVAKTGFDAMMNGEGSKVHGLMTKISTAAAGILPQGIMAEQHRKMAEPGSGKN
ncbi:MAG: SDR family NAD(P)-dependent oxidoreductase [Chitinophagales bacterium]|nr:SDR family NAD(P)-dependent oxidoreductase [Hyphomicrobiales bacterium]